MTRRVGGASGKETATHDHQETGRRLLARLVLSISESGEKVTGERESSHATISGVRVEHSSGSIATGVACPRLSWTVEPGAPGWFQGGYQVQAMGRDGLQRGDTGWVESGESVLVPWPYAPLSSREQVRVRVRARARDGERTGWSHWHAVESGLLHPEDWSARFITPNWDEDASRLQPCPHLRCEFDLRAPVVRGRLYITALGVYEAVLNGRVVGDHVLAPGWTSYDHRLRYQTFDVTADLREGPNALGAILGDGWYRGRLGFEGGCRNIWGNRLAVLAQLEVEYANGTVEVIATDERWRAATGPILASDLYDGETYDARLERPGWGEAGYSDADWVGVQLVERDLSTLVTPTGPPVRRIECLPPASITTSPSGATIVDFGQNVVGRLRITVQGDAGQTVTLRHAEVLESGELCTRPLRLADATDRYTLRGVGEEVWEPRFTFHGFRYAEVDGWPGALKPENICAVVCHSDLERTGWFDCSEPLVNRLHENIVWSMRGNFVDLPTDCPQRDERLGWCGDIQLFAPTACFLYDVAGLLTSWLADLAAEQGPDGHVPAIVPNIFGALVAEGASEGRHYPTIVTSILNDPPTAVFGDAAVILPWVLYQRYGDTGILETQYECMCKWVDLVNSLAGESRLWNTGFQYGDWIDPAAPPDRPWESRTDRFLVATAYFARSAELVALAARTIGKTEDEKYYGELAEEVRSAFDAEYISPFGRLVSDSATAFGLALQFGLLREQSRRRRAGERLAELIREGDYRISTGFVGTPLIADALCSVGEYEAAYRLLMQRKCPSWLYPVTMGASTVWERWDSLCPDGSVLPHEISLSFNHYALGAVADWLHRRVAGLALGAPGFRRLEICPQPGGGLTRARARHRTPYGLAETAWSIVGEAFELEVVVPPNVSATVTVPFSDGPPVDVGPGSHRWTTRFPASPNAVIESVDDAHDA